MAKPRRIHKSGVPNPAEPAPHKWRSYKPRRPSKWSGLNGMTGEPLPNTLDYWVVSAVRGHRGVVLDAAKTRELAARLGMVPTEPGQDQPAHRPITNSEVALGADLVQPYLPGLEPTDGVLVGDDGDFGADDEGPDE